MSVNFTAKNELRFSFTKCHPLGLKCIVRELKLKIDMMLTNLPGTLYFFQSKKNTKLAQNVVGIKSECLPCCHKIIHFHRKS